MKIVKHIITTLLWTVFSLYIILFIGLRIPAVQEQLGAKAAELVGRKLGTKVSVGRIDFGLFNRLILDNVTIFDQQQKIMLRAARLSAKIELAPLTQGEISVLSAQVFGARAYIHRKTHDAPTNFQFVIDSLASKDTTNHTPLHLRVNSFIMRHSSISYNQFDEAPTPGKFNPAHIVVNDISAHVILKTLTDDQLNVHVKRLSLNELSGINITGLSFRLNADRHAAQLTDFTLTMPDTRLHADSIHATYTAKDDGIDYGSASFEGSITDSYITLSDLRAFLNPLKNYQRAISLDASFHGTANSLYLTMLRMAGTDSSSPQPQRAVNGENSDLLLACSGMVKNWDQPSMTWHAQVRQLALSDQFIDFLTKTIPDAPTALRRLGSVRLSGDFSQQPGGAVNAKSTIASGIGDVALQLLYTRDRRFKGSINTQGINLRQLLDDEHFGMLAADTQLEGQLFNHKKPTVSAKGTIAKLEYNDYEYKNIVINGTSEANKIAGKLTIDDPNITADIEGELATPKMKLHGTVGAFRPQALHLTDQWGDALFSADIEADFTAHNINDATGTLTISNFTKDDYRLQELHVESGFEDNQHYVTLNSDFAQATLTGDFDYQTLAQSLANAIGSKLPSMPAMPQLNTHTDNNFQLQLTMNSADWLNEFFNIPVELYQPLTLQASVNDRQQLIELNGELPAFNYDGNRYQTAHVHLSSPADTMRCLVSLSKVNDDGHRLDIALRASAANDRIFSSLQWNNNDAEKPLTGTLHTTTKLSRDDHGKTAVHVGVMPSVVTVGPSDWDIYPADIRYADDRLDVGHFTIHHDDQHISIFGTASRHSQDTLTIDLSRVEVDYILDLVNFHAVDFNGEATGRAYLTGLSDKLSAKAQLRVDHFLFEHGRMGTLFAQAEWNDDDKQIDIRATANDGPGATTLINGYVAPVSSPRHPEPNILLDIQAQGTYIDLLQTYTGSFLSGVTGHARGAVKVIGPLSAVNLTGQLVVDGQATVIPLGTTYELRQDTVTFIPNEILLNRIPVYDRHGTMGHISGAIHHKELTNLTFDLNVEAENLLAYDYKDFGGQSFMGTVYASGNVNIEGRSGRVTINCDVTPQKNSTFTYNAAQEDAISDQSFITWEKRRYGGTEVRRYGDTDVRGDEPPLGEVLALQASFDQAERGASSTDLFLNFTINATPDATLRLLMEAKTGDYISLYGNGAIRATYYNKGTFQMFGTYTVDGGTYDITIQNIIHKRFLFQPGGTIVFGGDPYNAALALQALYTVSGVSLADLNIGESFSSNTIRVNCLMNISGQPNAPQVTFDFEMPTVNADEQQMVRSVINGEQAMNQQVLYLLGVGRFYNQGQNNAQMGQQDPTSLAMQSLLSGAITNQLNNLLTQVVKNDSWNFGANITTGTEGWNNAEYEGIINGKMLNNRLLINGQFGYRDNATKANPSFIGDFDVRYLLTPNGNLAMKVYNQTNDRYFTRSSLNTQGIGLIMKKDFNGLRELLHPKKAKKKKKKKAN